MKIIIFGTGEGYELYKPWFSKHEIVALLDNDDKQIGTCKDAIPIYSPLEGIQQEFDAIFILSIDYLDEMRQQLVMLGVPREKIFSYEQIPVGLKGEIAWQPLTIHCPDNIYSSLGHEYKLKIAFVTFDLRASGGASLGFLWAIKRLTKYHSICSIHLVSRRDGPLRDTYMKMDIPVIIDPNLYLKTLQDIAWKDSYDLLFFNTIHFANCFLCTSRTVPVIWWLHDSEMIYRGHAAELLDTVPQSNVSVYAVANLAEEAFRRRCPSWQVKRLSYGLEDRFDKRNPSKDTRGKIVFAVIGFVTERKATDVFVKAIEQLPPSKRASCYFWIVGRDSSNYAEKLKRVTSFMEDVHFWGEVSEKKLHELYQKISVLVCPSLEDPMPGVCAEAMMYHHPCIVSDNTGTAEYITPEKDGLICRAGDTDDLVKCMEWFIDNAEKIPLMGEAAREIYEQKFSMENFEKDFIKVINENLKGRFPDGFFRPI